MLTIRNCIIVSPLALSCQAGALTGPLSNMIFRRNILFVCICNALNDQTVRTIVASGDGTSPGAILRAAGCKPQCGRCLPEMAEMITEHKTASAFAKAAD